MNVDAVLREAIHAAVREVLPEVIRAEVLPLVAQLQEALAAEPANSNGEYVSTRKAAAIAGVQPATIRRWISDGRLTECRAGRHIRVRVGDLRACIEKQEAPGVIDLEMRARELLRRRAAG